MALLWVRFGFHRTDKVEPSDVEEDIGKVKKATALKQCLQSRQPRPTISDSSPCQYMAPITFV